MAGRRGRRQGAPGVALLLIAACGGGAVDPQTPPALRLSFEERLAPEAFLREGPAMRGDPNGAAGLWASVPGLPRPETAEIENLASGAKITVALFSAGRGATGPVRLSREAAEAIGIGAERRNVRITAIRTDPSLTDGF